MWRALAPVTRKESNVSMSWNSVEATIRSIAPAIDVHCSVIAPGGERWQHRGDVPIASASTAKIPIMIAIYRMLDQGTVHLSDRHTMVKQEHAGGSGILRHLHVGLTLTLADLLYLMMSISDNSATNILIKLAGMDNINATMRAVGMYNSILARPMVGRLAVDGEQENMATSNDYVHLLDALCKHQLASADACKAMLTLLGQQHNANRIGRHVKGKAGFEWGAKSGTNAGLVNEAGYVRGPDGTMIIAVYCQGVSSEIEGEQIIADMCKAAMLGMGWSV